MSQAFAYRLSKVAKKSGPVMPLGFPNECRFYDEAVHAVRFSGYDGALEAPFFIGERALKQIQPDMAFNESGLAESLRSQSRVDLRDGSQSVRAWPQGLV